MVEVRGGLIEEIEKVEKVVVLSEFGVFKSWWFSWGSVGVEEEGEKEGILI